MTYRTLALVLGAAIPMAAAGAFLAACSSSSSPGAAGAHDGGPTGDATTHDGDAGPSATDSGRGDSAAGFDCGPAPLLDPKDAGTILCVLADAGDLDCLVGQQCCLGGSLVGGQTAAAGCAAFGGGCSNGSGGDGGSSGEPPVPIECAQLGDCRANGLPAATACCLRGAAKDPAACAFPIYSGGTAIVCEGDGGGPEAGACAAGEVQVCSSPADCPAGKTCVAGRWRALFPGFCQ